MSKQRNNKLLIEDVDVDGLFQMFQQDNEFWWVLNNTIKSLKGATGKMAKTQQRLMEEQRINRNEINLLKRQNERIQQDYEQSTMENAYGS